MHSIKKYHFKDQQPGEEILQVVRRHWFDILVQYIPVLFMFIVVVGSFLLIPVLTPQLIESNVATFFFVESLILLVLWMYAAVVWIDYYLDVWIVTNRRVVNVEQKGLFLRQVSELRYRKIQDVTTEVSGVIPTFLNYGDVFIQTAGKQHRFRFHNVPNPYQIKARLVKLQKRARKDNVAEIEKLLKHTGSGDV